MSSVRSFSLTRSVFSQPCGVCPKTHPIFRLRSMRRKEDWRKVSDQKTSSQALSSVLFLAFFWIYQILRKINPRRRNFCQEDIRNKVCQLMATKNLKRFVSQVLVVRQDLKMGAGKIASQCAHAATGMYAELMYSQRTLLRQWEQSGQPKIVVTCKNQQEMNKIKEAAESIGLPTFVVADAGRTQVSAGSKTVLAVGPGPKELVDSVTGKLRLL